MKIAGGAIYVDGKKIMEVAEVTVTVADIDPIEKPTKSLTFAEPVEITGAFHISPWDMIELVTGNQPTNNWMKMHGGIMERKVQLRKARRLRSRKILSVLRGKAEEDG